MSKRPAHGVTITTHFYKTDPEMWGNYAGVSVHATFPDGSVIAQDYGDAYHDRGYERANGFVDALTAIYGSKFPVLRINLADREDY